MMGILETVISGFRRNDLKCLDDIYGTLLKGIQPLRVASTADLLDAIIQILASLEISALRILSRGMYLKEELMAEGSVVRR